MSNLHNSLYESCDMECAGELLSRRLKISLLPSDLRDPLNPANWRQVGHPNDPVRKTKVVEVAPHHDLVKKRNNFSHHQVPPFFGRSSYTKLCMDINDVESTPPRWAWQPQKSKYYPNG